MHFDTNWSIYAGSDKASAERMGHKRSEKYVLPILEIGGVSWVHGEDGSILSTKQERLAECWSKQVGDKEIDGKSWLDGIGMAPISKQLWIQKDFF